MSMPFTEQLTQSLAVMAQIPCSNHASNTDTSAQVIDMSCLRRVITYLDVGVINTSGTIQLYYQSSANSNFAGSTNSLGAATCLNCNTSNRVESLELRADQLPTGHRYVKPVITIGTTVANVGLITLAGGGESYKPANQFNTANVLDQAVVT